MSVDGFHWYWGEGTYPSVTYDGPFNSRDEAIEAAREDGQGPGDTINVLEADKEEPDFRVFDPEEVLERFEEQNMELWHEDGAEISLSEADKRNLERALSATFRAFMTMLPTVPYRVWTFNTTRNKEDISL